MEWAFRVLYVLCASNCLTMCRGFDRTTLSNIIIVIELTISGILAALQHALNDHPQMMVQHFVGPAVAVAYSVVEVDGHPRKAVCFSICLQTFGWRHFFKDTS